MSAQTYLPKRYTHDAQEVLSKKTGRRKRLIFFLAVNECDMRLGRCVFGRTTHCQHIGKDSEWAVRYTHCIICFIVDSVRLLRLFRQTLIARGWPYHKKGFLVAPSMNTLMYTHSSTRQHLNTLGSWGVTGFQFHLFILHSWGIRRDPVCDKTIGLRGERRRSHGWIGQYPHVCS